MRFAVVLMLVSGCFVAGIDGVPSKADDGSGSGSGSGTAGTECLEDNQCAPAGPKCCDCPTFAVPVTDPVHRACIGVTCPTNMCPTNVAARCDQGKCVLACVAMTCTATCADGYAIDTDGCLSCNCAMPIANGCVHDTECVRTRADCCGCARGGNDTAVRAQDQAAFDLSLDCPTDPQCPAVNTCVPGVDPHCVQGVCELTGMLPPNACGRPDLMACPVGQECVVNGSDLVANQQGVGVCTPIQ